MANCFVLCLALAGAPPTRSEPRADAAKPAGPSVPAQSSPPSTPATPATAPAAPPPSAPKPRFNPRDVAALDPLQSLIGDWRGVGAPQRGQTQDAWEEQALWEWGFDDGRAFFDAQFTDARHFLSLRILAGDKPRTLIAEAAFPGKPASLHRFTGQWDDQGAITLQRTDAPLDGSPARVSLRTLARGSRMVLLIEKRTAPEAYARLAEVGYTRKGSGFGRGGEASLCVVTGGAGSSFVTYKGQKYPVCCSGCRDLFNEDPEKALAEHRERQRIAAEKAAREASSTQPAKPNPPAPHGKPAR